MNPQGLASGPSGLSLGPSGPSTLGPQSPLDLCVLQVFEQFIWIQSVEAEPTVVAQRKLVDNVLSGAVNPDTPDRDVLALVVAEVRRRQKVRHRLKRTRFVKTRPQTPSGCRVFVEPSCVIVDAACLDD